jgi:hypothetical protein
MAFNPLNLDQFPAYLETLTPADWKPLIDLIPEIEGTMVFSEVPEIEEFEPGIPILPMYNIVADVVIKFQQEALNLNIIINFDWSAWVEGQKLAYGPPDRIDQIDLLTACKLITVFVRADRFSDGVLANSFESGLMLRVLKRIRQLTQK